MKVYYIWIVVGAASGTVACEPHLGICRDQVGAEGEVLDMTAELSEETRRQVSISRRTIRII
ncbi:MAG: hypothetical protein EF813_11080 [Methanosarcinales archaeon]|nr:MAG: hypothetical protein EF813_11080 [Methanosarcinales archaeon]